MRKKYPLNDELKTYALVSLPLGKTAVMLMQKTLCILFDLEKSDDRVIVEKFNIPFKDTSLKALLYSPKHIKKNAPIVVHYHGGGFVFPTAPNHFYLSRRFAYDAHCKVLLVDYPLAPKNKFPIPVEACFEALKWVVNNAKNLSINKSKIALAGDSAGGNLATTALVMAKDQKLNVKPCGQLLIYPAIGSRTKTKSMKDFPDTPICNSVAYEKYRNHYLVSKEDEKSPYISPLYTKPMTLFPKTYIETAEFDCLRDEAKMFARALKKAGVEVEIHNTKGTMHGYDMAKNSKLVQDLITKRVEFLKSVFK